MRTALFVASLVLLLAPATTLAEVPGLMNYQGTLTDDGGVALDTTVAMTFTMYYDSTGTGAIWTETQPSVVVVDGVFNVLLGSVNPLSEGLFGGTPSRWLGVQVGGDPELLPRQRIVTVAHAFHAAVAETAGYALSAPAANDGDWVVSGSDMYAGVSGNVGIGISAPATQLHVNGVVTATGGNSNQWNSAYGWGDHAAENYLKMNTTNTSSYTTTLTSTYLSNALKVTHTSSTNFATVYIENLYSGSAYALSAGMKSAAAGDTSYGVYGFNYGTGFGTYGNSFNAVGTGVRGINTSAGTFGDLGTPYYGVYGEYDSDTYGYLGGSDFGVYGQYQTGIYGILGGPTYGVYGQYSSYSHAKLGYSETDASFFYHQELEANGDGQSAAYAYRTRNSQNDGTGYGLGASNTAISGYCHWGDLYTFGTAGHNYNDFTRCGGVLGANISGAYWGSLGYENSGGSTYGGYFTSYTSGTGKEVETAVGIGLGAWGDLFGADIHGKVYGAYVEGGSYSLYSHGTVFMDDLNIHLQHTGEDVASVLYANVSTDVTVQTSGFATLSGGKAEIAFDRDFRRVVSSQVPVVVTVTPTGPCQGVYVSRVTGDGFTVVENNAGKSSVQVAFIAVGRRAGYEDPQLPEEVVGADYVEKLSRGLHNDADTRSDGQGLYFEDGELVVGVHPSTLPDPNKPVEEIEEIEQVQPPRPEVLPGELSGGNGEGSGRKNGATDGR